MTELESYDVSAYWNEIRSLLKEIEEHPRAQDDEVYVYFLQNITSNLIQLFEQLVQLDQMITNILESVRATRDSLYTESDTKDE